MNRSQINSFINVSWILKCSVDRFLRAAISVNFMKQNCRFQGIDLKRNVRDGLKKKLYKIKTLTEWGGGGSALENLFI